MKVLIVDDSPEALAVAKARLAGEDVEVVCADSGRVGLAAARRERPDLILLDIDMPDVSGLEVCKAIKSDAELSMVPIIFLTGSGSVEDKVRGLDMGAADYVTKPFDAFDLRARVRAALRTKRLQDMLVEHAHLDPLTELPNRRALTEHLARDWARMQRHGGPLSFVMVDLDHFKIVNDTYGHQVGDRLLRKTAEVISAQCRKSDLAARYGGEEFAILASANAAGAIILAERCRQAIADIRVPAGDTDVRITASFGVANADGLADCDALVRLADQALYQAKEAGRNRVRQARPAPDGQAVAHTC